MLWFFLIFSTLSWGIAEIFYKKGNLEKEKYSHLKTTIFVGILFGIYALIITIIQSVNDISFLTNLPKNMLLYLPVALCYLVSMTLSYFGVRFIEESISDPIENSSGAIVCVLTALFLHEFPGLDDDGLIENKAFMIIGIIAVVIVAVGVICVGFFDKKGKEARHNHLGKKLAIIAICMPLCYALLDAAGTFLDIYYTDDVSSTLLVGVTEDTLEHMANCCYEFTFFIVAMALLIFIKVKGEKLFSIFKDNDANKALTETNGEVASIDDQAKVEVKWYSKALEQKWKILAAVFETAGQATYLFALSEGSGIAAIILGAGTVITSLILSRIVLKEKLSVIQYIFIAIIMTGIIMLALVDI